MISPRHALAVLTAATRPAQRRRGRMARRNDDLQRIETTMNGSSSWQLGRGVRGGSRGRRALRSSGATPATSARDSWLQFASWPRRAPWVRRGSWLALILSFACQASVQADARVSGDTEADENIKSFDRPLETPETPSATADNDFVGGYALLGARHDLNYSGPKSPTCACLAVALRDQAKDAAFQWELEEPRVEPTSQWIIALSSNDVPCDAAPAGTLGASYQGYGTDGNDVVVYVEALGEGRPMTNGAIIPRPKATGSVFVEPTNAVYGRPLEGKNKRCKLNAPGSHRS